MVDCCLAEREALKGYFQKKSAAGLKGLPQTAKSIGRLFQVITMTGVLATKWGARRGRCWKIPTLIMPPKKRYKIGGF